MNNTSTSSGMLPGHRTSRRRKALYISFSILAILFIVWQFCRKPLLMSMYGIHTPRVENAESILTVARKYGLDAAGIVSVSPADHNSLFGLFGNSIPEALVFDKTGNYIEYKATGKDCNAGLFSFIPNLDRNKHYNLTGKTTLSNELARLKDLNGNPLPANYVDGAADYYILISWVAWAGKLNEDHVAKWEKLAAGNHKAKVQVIAVNFDVQQWWPAIAQDSILKKHGSI